MKGTSNSAVDTKQPYKALLLVRISTTKQSEEGEGPEHQIKRGLGCAKSRYNFDQDQILLLTEIWSGRKEDRPSLEQAFLLIETHQLSHLFVDDIDRLTRAGAAHYELTKRRLQSLGCELVDVKGVIQPARNSLEGSGAAFGGDFKYEWSVRSMSERAEVLAAQDAKEEACRILSRTIPVQISNVQSGRVSRPAAFGYKNIKIVDESGKPQPSMELYEHEAFYIRRMFEGMAAGRDVRGLCDELNSLGFKTRKYKRWNKEHDKVIGYLGEKPLTPVMVASFISKPYYAGFVCEKWTNYFPVKANFPALVSLELWNRANRNKWRIEPSVSAPKGWVMTRVSKNWKKRAYQRETEDFPYKGLISCPTCKSLMRASFSTSKTGAKHGYYHCNKGHKQVSIAKDKLHGIVRELLGHLEFGPELADWFEDHIRTVWLEKVGPLNQHIARANEELARLRDDADALFEKIKIASSPIVIKRLEQEYENLSQQISLNESKRDEREFKERDVNLIIKHARYFLTHICELMENCHNQAHRRLFWELIFPETPDLRSLKNRTREISPLMRLKPNSPDSKSTLVTLNQVDANFLVSELERWADQFELLNLEAYQIDAQTRLNQSLSLPLVA